MIQDNRPRKVPNFVRSCLRKIKVKNGVHVYISHVIHIVHYTENYF